MHELLPFGTVTTHSSLGAYSAGRQLLELQDHLPDTITTQIGSIEGEARLVASSLQGRFHASRVSLHLVQLSNNLQSPVMS